MNYRKKTRGSCSNPQNNSSNRESFRHGNQGAYSISDNVKDNFSSGVSTRQKETSDGVVNESTSRYSQETPMINSNEQKWPSLSNAKNSCTKGSNRASRSSESAMKIDDLDTIAGSACRPYGASYDTHSRGESLKNATNQFKGQNSPESSTQLKEASINEENARYGCTQSVSTCTPSKIELPTNMGHKGSNYSGNELSQSRTSAKRESDKRSSDHTDDNCEKRLDICPVKHGIPKLKTSLLDRNREKRKDLERAKNEPHAFRLRPGMVLLKNFISHADQIGIIKKCRELGLGCGGFYKPGYDDGAKLRLHMMCLGKNWDPQKKSYEEIRSVDGAKPPLIPDEFRKLVSEAIRASRKGDRVRNPDEAIPLMEPDICIVNFYTNTGKLGLHQDRDESSESLKKGLPVVSFSIGDSAQFLYGDERDEDKAEKVELKSGDVLVFGGKSRLIYHGVPSIIPNTAPKFLGDEANLRPGRLNLTFRKY